MKIILDFIERISIKTVELFAILLFLCISTAGAFRSARLKDGYGQKLFLVHDSILINIIFVIILFGILKIIADFIVKNIDRRIRVLLILTLVYTFAASLSFAALSKSFPTADQASVYYGANHFASDYFADIAAKNSYFSCYPHQMGLAFFYEVILRITNMFSLPVENFQILQALNAVFNCITVLSLYKITGIIFEEKKVSIYFLLMMILCLPMIWYTPFVYGELPSFAFSFAGVWLLLEGISAKKDLSKVKKIFLLTASIISLTVATAVRKNTLILIIAIVLTVSVYALKEKKLSLALYLVVLILLTTDINGWIILRYERCAGAELNDGVPGISHVVMGLQETEYAPGWYNGFNFNTYAYEADYNQAEAIRLSKIAINERLEKFKEAPAYAFDFFKDKFMAEWLNTGYACYDSTAGKYYDRLPIIESLYSGSGFYLVCFFMDKYQFAIYLSALIFVIREALTKQAKKDASLQCSKILRYILLVTILGGAIFYMVWEGSGRYILPYFIMTIPYAAAGMRQIEKLISSSFKNTKSVV